MIEKEDASEMLNKLKQSFEYFLFDKWLNKINYRPVVTAIVGGILRRWCKIHNENFKEMCMNMIIADALATVEEELK